MKNGFFIIIVSSDLCRPDLSVSRSGRRVKQPESVLHSKDNVGYMWFLTHEGIDRYNGKEFKRYKLMDGDKELNSLLNLNWLYIDPEGTLWEIGKKGKIFRYDRIHDTFELVYKLPIEDFKDLPAPITFSWIDHNNHIWLCNEETIFLYNTRTEEVTHVKTASAKL